MRPSAAQSGRPGVGSGRSSPPPPPAKPRPPATRDARACRPPATGPANPPNRREPGRAAFASDRHQNTAWGEKAAGGAHKMTPLERPAVRGTAPPVFCGPGEPSTPSDANHPPAATARPASHCRISPAWSAGCESRRWRAPPALETGRRHRRPHEPSRGFPPGSRRIPQAASGACNAPPERSGNRRPQAVAAGWDREWAGPRSLPPHGWPGRDP